jgi:hypothetical protein
MEERPMAEVDRNVQPSPASGGAEEVIEEEEIDEHSTRSESSSEEDTTQSVVAVSERKHYWSALKGILIHVTVCEPFSRREWRNGRWRR